MGYRHGHGHGRRGFNGHRHYGGFHGYYPRFYGYGGFYPYYAPYLYGGRPSYWPWFT